MRYLIIGSERPALAAESDAASVLYGVSEWELVWVSVSGCLKPWLWQLASESQLAWRSRLAWLLQCRWCRCWSRSCSSRRSGCHTYIAVAVAVAVGVKQSCSCRGSRCSSRVDAAVAVGRRSRRCSRLAVGVGVGIPAGRLKAYTLLSPAT